MSQLHIHSRVRSSLIVAALLLIISTQACLNIRPQSPQKGSPIGPLSIDLAGPVPWAATALDLDRNTALALHEIEKLSTQNADAGSVIFLRSFPATNELLAAYAGDQRFRRWDLNQRLVIDELQVKHIYEQTVDTLADGSMVLVATDNLGEVDGSTQSTFKDFEIYNLDTRERERCVFCQEDLGGYGVVFQPMSEPPRSIAYGFRFIGDTTMQFPDSELGRPADHSFVSRIAFDRTGDFVAVGYQQGFVRTYPFDNGEINIAYVLDLEQSGSGVGVRLVTQALLFDNTRTWLANLWGENLSVWKLSSYERQPYFEMSSPDARYLAFDPQGELLFVGKNDTLEVWDLEDKQLLNAYPAPGISSISASADGRLIVWGDEAGIIHFVGSTGS